MTVLATTQNQNDQFALTLRDRDIVFLGTGLSVFRDITFVHRCFMISGKKYPEIAMAYFVKEYEFIKCIKDIPCIFQTLSLEGAQENRTDFLAVKKMNHIKSFRISNSHL